MTKRTYRTAQGKVIDLGSILLQNENTRAVGNMNVNSRGDLIDGQNRVIDTRNRRTTKQYQRQTLSNVTDEAAQTSRSSAKRQIQAQADEFEQPELDMEPVEELIAEPAPVMAEPRSVLPPGGLAEAIAKARQIKQEPLPTPRKSAQNKPGVKKI
jgi:hypothetical protein